MRFANLYKSATILFTVYNLVNLTISQNSDWYDLLLKRIHSEPQSYQITLFSSEKSRAGVNELNSIFKKTIQQIPTVSIDLPKVGTLGEYQFRLPIFLNPRPSTLYIIFHHDESLSYLQRSIQFFVKSSPTPSRPKCLVVSFPSSSEIDSKELLKYTWSLKFLDFALLKVTDNDQPMFFEEYNPFFETFSQTDLSFGKFIFLDKMKDMNGFAVSVPLANFPPHSYVRPGTSMIVGYDHETTKLISRTLNYRMEIVRYGDLPGDKILEKLKSTELNTTDYTFLIGAALHKRFAIRSTSYRSDYVVVVVPIRSNDSSSMTIDFLTVFIYISFSCFMSISILFVSMLFKFTSGLWTTSYVIQIFLGVAVKRKPKACIERIVYITITMISFIYLTDLVADLTDKVVTQKDVISNSLEELSRSSLPIYMTKLYYRPELYDDSDELFKIINGNVQGFNKSLHCALENVKRRDRICIMPLSVARYVIAKHRNVDMSPILKIIEPPLFYDFSAFAFERASPFVDKFDQILCRIVESGILLKFIDQEMHSKTLVFATNITFENTNNIAWLDLIVILMIGYLGSTVVFLAELVVKAVKGRNIKFSWCNLLK